MTAAENPVLGAAQGRLWDAGYVRRDHAAVPDLRARQARPVRREQREGQEQPARQVPQARQEQREQREQPAQQAPLPRQYMHNKENAVTMRLSAH